VASSEHHVVTLLFKDDEDRVYECSCGEEFTAGFGESRRCPNEGREEDDLEREGDAGG
jgi:hypothetical protein